MIQALSRFWRGLNSRLRFVLRFCIILVFTLVLGHVTETLLSKQSFAHLKAWQADAFGSVSIYNPWNLASRYLCALETKSPLPPVQYPDGRCVVNGSVPHNACKLIQHESLEPVGCPDESYDLFGWIIPNAARTTTANGETPVGHWAWDMSGYTYPFVAFVDVIFHVFDQSTWLASIMSVFQFLIGLCLAFAVLVLMRGESNPIAFSMFLPILCIAFACLTGLALQAIMLGGLQLFGWITSIAGLCCGSTGVIYAIYELVVRFFETAAHEAVGATLETH